MKIKAILLSLLLVAAGATKLSAQCALNTAISDGATQHFGAIPGTLGTDITAKFWNTGTPANNSGTAASSLILTLSGGRYAEISNWNRTTTGACPTLAATTQTTTLVNVRLNEGAANHVGQYSLSTVNYQTATLRFLADNITNGGTQASPACAAATPNCVATPINIPTPVVQTVGNGATYNHATGSGLVRVTLNFGADAAGTGLYGYYATANNGTQPTAPLITGFKVYQISGTTAPTTSNVASWGTALTPSGSVTCTGGASANCTGLFTVTPLTGTNQGFLAAQLTFDVGGTMSTDFVSGNANPIAGPLAVEGLPTSIELYPTRVNNQPGFQVRWTSTNEVEVASYRIVASAGSNWVTLQDNVSAKGPGTYTELVSRRTLQSKLGAADSYQVKVVVVKRDGTTQDTGSATYIWNHRAGK